MARRQQLRVTLIHNHKAGARDHHGADLAGLLARADCAVSYFSYKHGNPAAALDRPADLIAVAGGDGTVAKVAAAARADGPPIGILPLGTANNIARSLGVDRPLAELAAGWRDAETRPYYPIAAVGPWGHRRIIEGIGFGAVEQAIAGMPSKPDQAMARSRFAAAALAVAPEHLELRLDGETIDARFVVLEVTNIPLLGPHLRLAGAADPSDRKFEICFIGDSGGEREALAQWFAAPERFGAAPVSIRAAERALISGRFRRVRLDGKVWVDEAGASADPEPVELAAEDAPLTFLVPR